MVDCGVLFMGALFSVCAGFGLVIYEFHRTNQKQELVGFLLATNTVVTYYSKPGRYQCPYICTVLKIVFVIIFSVCYWGLRQCD